MKKEAKTFSGAVADSPAGADCEGKSFLVLFFKKEPLSSYALGESLMIIQKFLAVALALARGDSHKVMIDRPDLVVGAVLGMVRRM